MAKGYLIDPEKKTITEEWWESEDGFNEAKKLMDTDMAERVTMVHNDVLLVDEEGLLKEKRHFFFIEGYPQPLCGKAMYTRKMGQSEPRATLYEVKAMVEFPRTVTIPEK